MPKWFRITLYLAAIINLNGAIIFYPPFRLGRKFLALPANTDPLYLSIISAFIAIFALAYYYLASKQISNPLFITVSILAKLFFGLSLVYYGLLRANSSLAALAGFTDIAFAILFAVCLFQQDNAQSTNPS